ncbi:MAG: hypothetical protein K8R53_01000, partial [Bacteroidales bacterium]|nr:hypothetical protein [Bacteroidales bacterium]
MSKYLIKLSPVDTYFFGQENKYRKKHKEGKKETVADYYQASLLFPQQTSILGLLRYYILQQNKQIPVKDKAFAEKLVGRQSFDPDLPNPTFGM